MVKDIPKIIIGSVPGHLKTLRALQMVLLNVFGLWELRAEVEDRLLQRELLAGLPYGIFKVLLAIWLSSYDLASFFKILLQCVWLMMVWDRQRNISRSFLLFCESWYVPIMFIFQPSSSIKSSPAEFQNNVMSI